MHYSLGMSRPITPMEITLTATTLSVVASMLMATPPEYFLLITVSRSRFRIMERIMELTTAHVLVAVSMVTVPTYVTLTCIFYN
jgi:hypothetical protein